MTTQASGLPAVGQKLMVAGYGGCVVDWNSDASVIVLADTSWPRIRIAAAGGESQYRPDLHGENRR